MSDLAFAAWWRDWMNGEATMIQIANTGSGGDVAPIDVVDLDTRGYEFTVDWFTAYANSWRRVLHTTGVRFQTIYGDKRDPNISSTPLRIMEIGSFEGRSACWISDNLLDHPDSMLTCVDTFKGSPEDGELTKIIADAAMPVLRQRFVENISKSRNANKINYVQQSSLEYLPWLLSSGGYGRLPATSVYDIIYVDGDHRQVAAYSDIKCAHELIKDGGVIIVDDYLWDHGYGYPVMKACHQAEEELGLVSMTSGTWQRYYHVDKSIGGLRGNEANVERASVAG